VKYDYWISTNKWAGWKDEYLLDENGNTAIVIHYNLNMTTNKFVLTNKSYCYYSSKNGTSSLPVARQNSVMIFPNPVKDHISIEIDNKTSTCCSIYNFNGQLMVNYPIQNGRNTFDVSRLSQGLYTLQIQTKNGLIIQKMVKE
jgi:hypothetical protein